MIYDISPYSFKIAKKLKVIIKPSIKPKYKIDIFDRDNNYITSIGAKGYNDYELYLKNEGEAIAHKKRILYYGRHKKDLSVENSRGFYAWKILWRG